MSARLADYSNAIVTKGKNTVIDKEPCLKLRDEWYEEAKKQTLETLPAFVAKLAAHQHDYNTICYATAAAAVGAAWAMDKSPNGGITGFQGGAIMWEFMDAWNGVKAPARLLKFEDMLFPQYGEKFNSISAETWNWVQEEAKKKLEEKAEMVDPNVVDHWRSIRDGHVPFGLQVRA